MDFKYKVNYNIIIYYLFIIKNTIILFLLFIYLSIHLGILIHNVKILPAIELRMNTRITISFLRTSCNLTVTLLIFCITFLILLCMFNFIFPVQNYVDFIIGAIWKCTIYGCRVNSTIFAILILLSIN